MPELRRQFLEHWDRPAWREVLSLVAGSLHESHNRRDDPDGWSTSSTTACAHGEFEHPPGNIAMAAQCGRGAGTLHQHWPSRPRRLLNKDHTAARAQAFGRNEPGWRG